MPRFPLPAQDGSALIAAAGSIDWSKVGQRGCTPRYTPDENTGPYAVRHTMERAANAPEALTEALEAPDGSSRPFRVICVDYGTDWYRSDLSGARYVVAPEDSGWVLKAVMPFMRQEMRPVLAKPSRSVLFGSRWITAPAWAHWIQTRWVCPNCIPRRVGERHWDNGSCAPKCDVSADPSLVWSRRYGYDIRVMVPWVRDIISQSPNHVCDPLADQPGSQVEEPPPCLPVPVQDVYECRSSEPTEALYWQDFWGEVGTAITRYNAASRAAAEEAKDRAEPLPPAPPPPPPAPVAPVTSPPPSQAHSALPAVLVGAAALATVTILWRRRAG